MDIQDDIERRKRRTHDRLFEHRESWPELPLEAWRDTATLHMWTQIVGKVRLALSPYANHCWRSALYVTTQGLSTWTIPYDRGIFEIEFDFLTHKLRIQTSEGAGRAIPLEPQSVEHFYRVFMQAMSSLGIKLRISTKPAEASRKRYLVRSHLTKTSSMHLTMQNMHSASGEFSSQSPASLNNFSAGFLGKCRPVHFFWGSFDLPGTRFSGQPAPERLGADPVTREAYSHEVSSAGFWPGGGDINGAASYSYTVPEPPVFSAYQVRPSTAFYHAGMKEFLLMYDVFVMCHRKSMLMDFLQRTYAEGAKRGHWDATRWRKPRK